MCALVKRSLRFFLALTCAWLGGWRCVDASPANTILATRQPIGDISTTNGGWKGIQRGGILNLPGEAVFVFFAPTSQAAPTINLRAFYGLQFEVKLDSKIPLALEVALGTQGDSDKVKSNFTTHSSVSITGAGWHTVTLPWSSFNLSPAHLNVLDDTTELHLNARLTEGKGAGKISLRAVRLIAGDSLALSAEIRGHPARPGDATEYAVTIGNCTDSPQAVTLMMDRSLDGRMTSAVEPATLQLAPGETKNCVVKVQVAQNVPPGERAEQILRAIPNGDGLRAATLSFTTASFLPHPYIVHTSAEWQEVRDKVRDHAWAKQAQDYFLKKTHAWIMPDVTQPFSSIMPDDENNLLAAAYSWQLTHDPVGSAKAALFLTRLVNFTGDFCNPGADANTRAQAGYLIQKSAMAFDSILDAGVLTDTDRIAIEKFFRDYISAIQQNQDVETVDQTSITQTCAALYAALAIQDWNLADHFLSGTGGIHDQMARGIMADGWWRECSVNANLNVASQLSQAALALRPWGVDLASVWITPHTASSIAPAQLNHLTLKQLWDALPPFVDFRGTIFGLNDSTEQTLATTKTATAELPFELACYLYRDPAYATIIKQSDRRDLIYGVAELPEMAPDATDASVSAESAGLAMLRSHARQPRERIEAVLRYGIAGGGDKHFDSGSLLALQRYGKSFYNPMAVWYGTNSFMHRLYVQSSIAANMIVVDGEEQAAISSTRELFYAGDFMQAAAAETVARWHYPIPTDLPGLPNYSMKEKQWLEGRSFPVPTNAPATNDTEANSELISQRRLLIVMPDYVVLADFVKAPQTHVFDNLFHIRGFTGLTATQRKLIRHDGQMTLDSRTAAQFITDCNWYDTTAPSRAAFNDTNSFKMDVVSLWPSNSEIMVATAPEAEPVNKQVTYTIRGDGNILREGKTGTWVLGSEELDLPLDGINQLKLETRVNPIASESRNSVLWGNPRVILADGSEKSLLELPVNLDNLLHTRRPDRDYFSGTVKIAGIPFDTVEPAEPEKPDAPAIVTVDLTGIKAVRFRATLGGDYPVGNDAQQRTTYSIRSAGTEVHYLTLLEPHEKDSVVRKAEAFGPNRLEVHLTDGRVQEIEIHNFAGDGSNISVHVQETRNGQVLHSETTGVSDASLNH